EPTSLALAPDGSTLLVTSRWAHTLTALATSDLSTKRTVDLPRDPNAVVASSDGTKAFVAHVAGSRISVIDLEADRAVRSIELHDRQTRQVVELGMAGFERVFREGKPVLQSRDQRAVQGFSIVRASTRILAPQAMVDTGNGVRSHGYGEARTAFGDVAAIDERNEKRVTRPAFDGLPDDCLLPRAAAIDAEDHKLVVACLGLDTIVAYDAASDAPHRKELRRYLVPSGPEGVAVDDRHRAVVWSSFQRSLSVVDLRRGKGNAVRSVGLSGGAHMTEAQLRGRELFHQSGGGRVAFDGRACASCHP